MHSAMIVRRVTHSASLTAAPRSAVLATLVCCRYFAKPSAVQGPLTNHVVQDGFVTEDVTVDQSQVMGGQYARGIYARRDMSYGREIMNVPAFCMYIGEEPLRQQILILTKQIFTKLVQGHVEKSYIEARIMTMASGGFSYFTRERDVLEFAESVRDEKTMKNGAEYCTAGEFSTFDLQKLPLILEFNRWEVEYRGRKGVCIFPEAQYFNHQCEPNVEVSITYSNVKNNFVLSARTCKPIKKGEELFINYMPGNKLPLSRFSIAMRDRWGFECTCMQCKSRSLGAVTVVFLFVMLPIGVSFRRFYVSRMDAKQRGL